MFRGVLGILGVFRGVSGCLGLGGCWDVGRHNSAHGMPGVAVLLSLLRLDLQAGGW